MVASFWSGMIAPEAFRVYLCADKRLAKLARSSGVDVGCLGGGRTPLLIQSSADFHDNQVGLSPQFLSFHKRLTSLFLCLFFTLCEPCPADLFGCGCCCWRCCCFWGFPPCWCGTVLEEDASCRSGSLSSSLSSLSHSKSSSSVGNSSSSSSCEAWMSSTVCSLTSAIGPSSAISFSSLFSVCWCSGLKDGVSSQAALGSC